MNQRLEDLGKYEWNGNELKDNDQLMEDLYVHQLSASPRLGWFINFFASVVVVVVIVVV